MAVLNVIDRSGARHVLDTVEGWRVMELVRDQRLGLEGVCGGACACASCHVIVADEWASRLPPPHDEELMKLDELPVLETHSRLACQIIWRDDLDGLTVTLAEAT